MSSPGKGEFRNCIFYDCGDRVFSISQDVLIENCVFTHNRNVIEIHQIYTDFRNIIIRNCIFWDNEKNIVILNIGRLYNPNDLLVIEYSDFNQYLNYDEKSGSEIQITGETFIDADPLWVDPSNNDFHLQQFSPCIDAGHPNSQYKDTDGSRNDMGAYGGQYGNW